VPSDPSDAPDSAHLTGFDDHETRGSGSLKDQLRAGARLDLTAASFLWQRRPRQARRLLGRASDVLDWLAQAQA
jgi:hypothetical protein